MSSSQPSTPNGRLPAVAAAALVALYLSLTLSTASTKSAHFDETAHVAAGYAYVAFGDFRFTTGNLMLGQTLAALPLQSPAVHPFDARESFQDKVVNTFNSGRAFLYESGNDPQVILMRGRTMMALLGALTALAVFLWSRRLFGPWGGVVSLVFLATCPTFISLGGVIGADMAAACFFLWTTWAFWTLLHRLTPWTVAGFALAAALLLLSKLSSLVFGPVCLALLAVRFVWHRPLPLGWGWTPGRETSSRTQTAAALAAAAVASLVIVWGVVWAAYRFRYSAAPVGATGLGPAWARFADDAGPMAAFVQAARAGHWLPEAFLRDLMGLADLTGSRTAFFLGEVRRTGWALYFPFTFVAKSSPFLLAGLAASGALALRRRAPEPAEPGPGDPPARWYPYAPLVAFVAVYMTVAIFGNINIGHRHILPIYPFLFVLAGGVVLLLRRPSRAIRGVFVATVLGALATVPTFHPNPLAYFSPLVGAGARPYRLLIDSSLEWGQELPALARWLKAHERADEPPYLSYFGSGRPGAYGIRARPLPSFGEWEPPLHERLRPGTYILSGTMLEPVYYGRGRIAMAGPWSDEYERVYRRTRPLAEAYYDAVARTGSDPRALEAWMAENRPRFDPGLEAGQAWEELLDVYDLARFARLTRALRERPAADEVIAGSFFVFRLSGADLRAALD